MSRVTQSSGVELYLCSESSLLTVSILHCNTARARQAARHLRVGPNLKLIWKARRRQRGLMGGLSRRPGFQPAGGRPRGSSHLA